ncbi:MAG: helix-turn-helix transcriptional regulator [Bacteroidales bacterium]|nr:helix-turn-helix transcriptional regulator [Bacteroidales bacterium]
MELKERIEALLEYSQKNISEFSRYVGFKTPQAVRELLKGNTKSLSEIAQNKISSAFPELNMDWLLNGRGDMLLDEADTFQVPEGTYYEDDIPERFMTYLVPTAAIGGGLIGFEEEGIRKEDCERIISPIPGAEWAIPVCGDSMEPEYPNGSRVFVKQINPRDFIAWGNVFVLDTTNGLIIKVVMQSDKDDCVRCVSLNPSGRYQPFDVPLRTIRAMYRVMACMSVK